jgi:DnaJ-domain-containing protein 1
MSKRRRFLWCAWWLAPPAREPFRAPDAWSGGARSALEARAEAERAAGQTLREIESAWAGAWVRTLAGLPPWIVREPRERRGSPTPANDPHVILGVRPGAPLVEVKRAFRALALVHHPDRGGSAIAFVRVKRAYETIVANAEKRAAKSEKRGPAT